MLWTSPRNFKIIETQKNLKERGENLLFDPKKRINHKVENNCVFSVENLLTPQECDYYIEQTNLVGYEDLTQQFEKDYRGSKS
jgi:hypothetical protein